MITTWMGKPIEDCSKEELFSCVQALAQSQFDFNTHEIHSLKDEITRLSNENTRLWNCLGANRGTT